MKQHLAFLAVLPCFGIIAFCQSPVISSNPDQTPPNRPAASVDSHFEFKSGQFRQISPSAQLPRLSCDGQNPSGNQAPAQSSANHRLPVPCLDPQVFALNAQNSLPFPQPRTQRPRAKSIPIPTQWPDAKYEPIPTTWPNLKLLLLAPPNSTSPLAK
jgi:hypothetical protein